MTHSFDFKPPTELIKRQFDEKKEISYRSEFMHDRDRVLYSTAFRRLAGKTQIYTTGIDDHRRNRLTHTLEVSQIARTIAGALNLDCDLTEAIALAHDLGHTPFGHAGEQMLHEIMIPDSKYIKQSPLYQTRLIDIKKAIQREDPSMEDCINSMFGFKHNIQGVRVVAVLEDSYRGEKGKNIGLNLTNFALWGIRKHSKLKYEDKDTYPNYQEQLQNQVLLNNLDKEAWSFEAYIVEIADDIAQWHHDLEDALRGKAMHQDKILTLIEEALGKTFAKEDQEKFEVLKSRKILDRKYIADLSHIVVNTLVTDIVENSKKALEKLSQEMREKNKKVVDIFSDYEACKFSIPKEKIIAFSEELEDLPIKKTIRENVHHSRDVERMNEKGKYIIRKLFEAYYAHAQQLPDGPVMHFMVEIGKYSNIDEAKTTGVGEIRSKFAVELQNLTAYKKLLLMRRICDHIASMTDHYAIDEYQNLYG